VPLSFFPKHRVATSANVIGFGLGTIVFGIFLLLSLYMQQVLGYSPIETGVAYLAIALTAIFASGAAQALVTRIGVRAAMIIGMALLAAGLIYLTRITPESSYWSALFPGYFTIGVGLGFSFVPVSIAALAGVDPTNAGLASGLINTSQQIGGAFGIAIFSTVATSVTGDYNPANPPPDITTRLTDGFSRALWVAAGFAVASLIVVLTTLRGPELAEAGKEGGAHIG
jgi:MFS family permease